jgi:hypothetical protein
VRRYRPDRVLQIIEGSITLFLGVTAFFLLPDFPESNTFLSPDQTTFVLQRVEEDRGDSIPEQLTFRKVIHHLGCICSFFYGMVPRSFPGIGHCGHMVRTPVNFASS